MKITIDTSTTPHMVEIDGSCTIGELIEFLSKYYGDFTWKDIRITGKGYSINLPRTMPFNTPGTGTWPTIGGPYTGTPFPGTTITYCSDNNTFTNSAGEPIEISNLLSTTS